MALSPQFPYWSAIGGFRLTAAETVEPASNMPDQQQTLDQLRAGIFVGSSSRATIPARSCLIRSDNV